MNEKVPLTPSQPSKAEVVKSIVFILITLGVAYFVTVSIGIENLREAVLSTGAWGPFIIILVKATTIVVAPLGGGPVYAVAGALFGFWTGYALSLAGDMLGATIAFYLSKVFGRSILKFFIGKHELPLVEKLISRGFDFKTIMKTRFFMIGFPELFAYAAGLTTASYPVFILAHMSFHLVSNAIMVAFGSLIVSGNLFILLGAGVASLILAFVGMKWLKVDLLQNS